MTFAEYFSVPGTGLPMRSFGSLDDPMRDVSIAVVSLFPDETTEAQKGYVTCPTPHSRTGSGPSGPAQCLGSRDLHPVHRPQLSSDNWPRVPAGRSGQTEGGGGWAEGYCPTLQMGRQRSSRAKPGAQGRTGSELPAVVTCLINTCPAQHFACSGLGHGATVTHISQRRKQMLSRKGSGDQE